MIAARDGAADDIVTQQEQAQGADAAEAAGRDGLGKFCFWLHVAVMLFVVSGWLVPYVPVLVSYLIFLPVMFLQWRMNKSSCVLNNIESLLRTGHWRNPANREEGAWLRTLLGDVLGIHLTGGQMDIFMNSAIFLLWMLGLGHLIFWYAPGLVLNSP